jgi:hypothetical protein
LDDLLLERFREPPSAEIPPVELLQEPAGPVLAELTHSLADEEDQLRGNLLARGLLCVAVEDLAQRPWVALRTASDHHGRCARHREHALRPRA